MGILSSLLGILGFGIGICSGLLVGFFLFIYREPNQVKDPVMRPLDELDTSALEEIIPEIPMWVKNPNYDRVDWLNKFISQMWPYLDKAVCAMIRSTAKPLFTKYIGEFYMEAIDFENLSLGTLSPSVYGMKVYETNEEELVIEPAVRWAGNPNIVVVLKLLSLRITIHLVDVQVFATPRITLKPLVPTFPCFANIVCALMEKPHVDFGMKILGGDIMSIPGLYQFVQETIRKQVARLYLWPQTLQIPILDASTLAVKKPVGILHVKVVRAVKLLKMDFLGTSDPYVKLSFSGERLSAKRTSIKMKNLNPEWNEKFKLIVKDTQSQALELQVYDWDKVGGHDRLGMQIVPLKVLSPNEMKEFTLDLVKNTNLNDPQNKKQRGQLVVELTFVPFKTESGNSCKNLEGCERNESVNSRFSGDEASGGAGLLSVMIHGAENVEGGAEQQSLCFGSLWGRKKENQDDEENSRPELE